jgi:hypothetical protein
MRLLYSEGDTSEYMIEGLKRLHRVEECCFNTIFCKFKGHRIHARRKVAEKIEIQTRYSVALCNVDVKQDKRYLAEKDLFPCGDRDESRFSPDFEVPLSTLDMRKIIRVQVLDGHESRFGNPKRLYWKTSCSLSKSMTSM